MTVIHQDEFALAPHPIDMLERTVEENGWAFERAGRDELNLSVAGKWSDDSRRTGFMPTKSIWEGLT